MKKLRVLIFSTTYGAGHVRASEAIIQAIRKRAHYSEIIHLDYGECLSKPINSIIKNTYIAIIKHYPKIYGIFYYGTTSAAPNWFIQRFLNSFGMTKLKKIIHSLQPDLIICTFPTVAGVMSQLRMKNILNKPIVTVVTDYAAHSQWIHFGVDMYIVGCSEVFEELVSRGINPERIHVTGIPVNLKFERFIDGKETISKLGLFSDRKTILLMGGAYGVLGRIKEVCRNLAEMEYPVQLIVVCGQDKKLYNELSNMVGKTRNPVVVLGFVKNIEELMAAADVMITKAGGLIVSEALTQRLPSVIFMPIPGQEEANAGFLSRIGAGKVVYSINELKSVLHSLLEQPDQLEAMKRAASKAIPGFAAERAVEYMLHLMGKNYPGDI